MLTVDDLWGSYITGVSVDLAARRVVIAVTLADDADAQHVSLDLDGVTEMSIRRPSEGWERVELTEVHISDTAPVQVELVLWNEPDGLAITCTSARVTVP